jgi:hypothetical protein
MRQNCLAAWAGVTSHQTFDIDGWFGSQQFQRFEVIDIVNPMTHAELLLNGVFALPLPSSDLPAIGM